MEVNDEIKSMLRDGQEYKQLVEDIKKSMDEDEGFYKELEHILELSGDEKQKYIDSNPRIKAFQNRKYEIIKKLEKCNTKI